MADRRPWWIGVILLALCGCLSVVIQLRGRDAADRPLLPRHLPMVQGAWQGTPFFAVMPKDVRPGDFLLFEYRAPQEPSVNLLALHSPIANYHPPSLCYRGSGRQLTEVSPLASNSGRIRLAGLMGRSTGDELLVYHGFYIAGRIVPDGMGKKMYEIGERIRHGRIRQYFFEVTTPVENKDVEKARERLRRFLDAMEPYLLQPAA